MNIHGHCYVLPLAAVGASTTSIPHHPSVLPSNTNINQMNNAQLATQMSCGINPLSMGNNGSGAQANNCNSTLQGSNYTSLSHESPASKYLVGAQTILPHLLQEQHTHLRQPHQPLIHLNPNHHQLNHALQLQHPHQQPLLSIPYQTNNLQAATLTPTAFHPFFATPSMPRSTSNLSNLSNFSSQHHSPKNVQQIGQVAAASGHQHLEQHNLQNCSATHSDTQHHHHGHQQIQDHHIARHHLHNIPSQTALQTSSDPQIYNPFLTSASLLSASNIIPKAPLLQTPAIGKVGESIQHNFYIYELEYHLSFPLFLFSLSDSYSSTHDCLVRGTFKSTKAKYFIMLHRSRKENTRSKANSLGVNCYCRFE